MATNNKGRPAYRDEDRSLDLYLHEIGATPLIDQDEEMRLCRRYARGDKKSLEKLINANLKFVVSIAKLYQNQGMSMGDLINEGNFGLIRAAKRFDETRGFKFISYAVWWIRQSILMALAEQSRIVRIPLNRVGTLHKIRKITPKLHQDFNRDPTPEEISKALKLPLKDVAIAMEISNSSLSLDTPFSPSDDSNLIDVLENETSVSPDEGILSRSLRQELEKALATLTKRQAEVIRLYYGLDRETGLTLDQIGQIYDLTRERVRQIKEKGIKRLRHVSRSRSLRVFLS